MSIEKYIFFYIPTEFLFQFLVHQQDYILSKSI